MRFRLDGKCFIAAEDPDDGYRSAMRDLVISYDAKMKNVFEPLRVLGRHRTKSPIDLEGEYDLGGKDDVLELVDVVTGKIVIEVGTTEVEDYYPGYVASFHPEAMAHNAHLTLGKTAIDTA